MGFSQHCDDSKQVHFKKATGQPSSFAEFYALCSRLGMLSRACVPSTFVSKRSLLGPPNGRHRKISRPSAQIAPQRRHFLYIIRSLWHLYGPRRKLNTEFKPSSSEVRFTKDNVWARAGPEQGTLLFGITEQAKVRSNAFHLHFSMHHCVLC